MSSDPPFPQPSVGQYARALRRPDEQWWDPPGQSGNQPARRPDPSGVPEPGPSFDEAWYLASNSDVAEAVTRGEFLSAWHHYLNYGQHEGRPPAPPFRPADPGDETSAKGPLYLAPTELAVTPLRWTRVALVGSYSLAAWDLHRAGLFGCPVDRFSSEEGEPSIPVDPVLEANKDEYDLIVVEIALRSILPDMLLAGLPVSDTQAHETALRQVCAAVESRLRALLGFGVRHRIPMLVANFPLPQRNALGVLASRYDVRNPEFFLDRVNQHLEGFVRSFDQAYILDVDRIAASVGRRGVQDDSLELLSRNSVMPMPEPVTDRLEILGDITSYFDVSWPDLLPQSIGNEIVSMCRALRQSDPVRLVVVNLDTTLWSGIRGDVADVDDGLVEGWPIGLCEALILLGKRGIRLALCSGHDPRWVSGVWPRIFRDRISLADFAVVRIDRRPAAAKMRDILRVTGLDARAVLYIDGNPIERTAIKEAYPTVRVLGKNPYLLRRILLWSAELMPVALPEGLATPSQAGPIEDADIVQADNAATEPESFRLTFVELRDPADPRLPSAIDLLNGANQFNTTGERWRDAMLAPLFASGGSILAFSADDGFSDFGLVGVLVIEPGLIRQMAMSLDSAGKGFELAAVSVAVRHAMRNRTAPVGGRVVPTAVNHPSRDVFAAAGFVRASDSLWMCRGPAPSVPTDVTVIFPERPAEPATRDF